MTRTILLTCTALAALPVHAPMLAAQETFALDEITVTATRSATERARTGAAVSVLEGEQIERRSGAQLSDAFARLPGVSVSRSGPPGTDTGLRIRGSARSEVAVFIDGIRVDDPSQPQVQFDFGGLGPEAAGRAELLRGSQSALYGGSAIAGVVNIESPRPEEDGVAQRLSLEGGSFGTLRGSYGFTHREGDSELTFGISHIRSDGFSASAESAANPDPDDDAHRATRIRASARHAVNDALTLGASVFAQKSETEFDDGPFADADNLAEREEAGARVFAEFERGATRHTLGLSRYYVRRDIEDSFGESDFTGTRTTLDYLGETELSERFALVYGGDVSREEARSSFGLDAETTTAGAYLQGLFAPDERIDLSATLRVDDNSDFGTYPTGRLSAALRPQDDLTLRANLGTGFRAPSNSELFAPGFGNPDLDVEESLSADIGAEYAFGGHSLSGTLFYLQTDEAIVFDPVTGSYDNIPGRSERRGIELAAGFDLGARFDLDANYTYTEAEDADGNRLFRVPRHDLTLALDSRITERLSNTTSVQFIGDRVDTLDGATPRAMGDYTVVNTRFDFAVSDSTELTLRVENLFDEDYQEIAGFSTAERSAYLGLSSRF